MKMEDKIKKAIQETRILKHPEKLITSFSPTTVHYYILTVPLYLEFEGRSPESETVIREGSVTWKQPKLITPAYMLNAEGFSDEARKAFEMMALEDSDLAMLLYGLKFKKDSEKMEIVPEPLSAIAEKISAEIDKTKAPHSVIIKGIDEFWDVALSKFVQEMIVRSAYFSQVPDLMGNRSLGINSKGFPVVSRDSYGIPIIAKKEIDLLFKLFEKGELEPNKLKEELDRWGVFEKYQDRFFKHFNKN